MLTGVFRLVGTGGKPRATETAFATKRERISPVRARRDFSASKTGRGNAMHTETPRALAGLRTPRLFFFPRIDAEIFARVEADFGACFHASIFFSASIFGLFFEEIRATITQVQFQKTLFEFALGRHRLERARRGASRLPAAFFCVCAENARRVGFGGGRGRCYNNQRQSFSIISRSPEIIVMIAAAIITARPLSCLVGIEPFPRGKLFERTLCGK